MLVICNGMPRSASTWSFNVAVGLLRRSTPVVNVHGGYNDNVTEFLASVPAGSHAVLKCHLLDAHGRSLSQTGAAKVIYTKRDLADAVVSFMAMFGARFEQALTVIYASLQLYRLHVATGHALIVDYDQIISSPIETIGRIAGFLAIDATPTMVDEIDKETSFQQMRKKVEQIDAMTDDSGLIRHGRTVYDPTTLINKHHIRDGRSGYGRHLLSQEQMQRIDALKKQFGLR
jgi:hypothetical protein